MDNFRIVDQYSTSILRVKYVHFKYMLTQSNDKILCGLMKDPVFVVI